MLDPLSDSPPPTDKASPLAFQKFTPVFNLEFRDKLLQPAGANPVRDRASSFGKIFEILDTYTSGDRRGRRDFFILETGTMRPDHGNLAFGDDGCSTVIFDRFMDVMGTPGGDDWHQRSGSFVSIDINEINCAHAEANTRFCEVVCSDSVPVINRFPESIKWDLIYLDSFDVVRDNPHPSALHHLMELCACMKNIRQSANGTQGTIVCIDDADAFFDGGKTGKAMYVREFMDRIGARKIHDGYQLVYQF